MLERENAVEDVSQFEEVSWVIPLTTEMSPIDGHTIPSPAQIGSPSSDDLTGGVPKSASKLAIENAVEEVSQFEEVLQLEVAPQLEEA